MPPAMEKVRRGSGDGERREEYPRPLPKMVVFDLDACVWEPEMYQLPGCPSQEVRGSLPGGEGVVGMRCGSRGPTVRLFPGALRALNELRTNPELADVEVACASSSRRRPQLQRCRSPWSRRTARSA
eukprot:TRINITY_DN16688_c0_g1_i2.p2 TRINITY_DN16688_c0_g1~~TRINITY_DN16688_c0_g1_i2.p2  ORF type:complete len:139 (+),score=13.80 TRINITY_DN16688_c0_g1_i2:38-418(+)